MMFEIATVILYADKVSLTQATYMHSGTELRLTLIAVISGFNT